MNPPVNDGVQDLAESDRHFLTQSAVADFVQKQASQLAAQRSSSASVREYARHLLSSRARTEDQINLLAQSKAVTLAPADAGEYASLLAELKTLTGSSFDRAYRDRIVIGLDQDQLRINQEEQQNGTDQDLKTLAQTTSQMEQAEINAAAQIGAPPRSAAANSSLAHHPT